MNDLRCHMWALSKKTSSLISLLRSFYRSSYYFDKSGKILCSYRKRNLCASILCGQPSDSPRTTFSFLMHCITSC